MLKYKKVEVTLKLDLNEDTPKENQKAERDLIKEMKETMKGIEILSVSSIEVTKVKNI